MSKVLIIAEHDGVTLNPSVAKCVSCAAAIDGAEVDIVVLAASAGDIAAEAATLASVNRVITIEREENASPVSAVLAPQVAAVAADYSHVFGPSTTFGKDLMPRVAALLGVNQVSDIMTVGRGQSHLYAARVRWQRHCDGRSARRCDAGCDCPCRLLEGRRRW